MGMAPLRACLALLVPGAELPMTRLVLLGELAPAVGDDADARGWRMSSVSTGGSGRERSDPARRCASVGGMRLAIRSGSTRRLRFCELLASSLRCGDVGAAGTTAKFDALAARCLTDLAC